MAAALTEELGLLSQPTRALLDGAAVAGDPFEPELAAAAAGADDQTATQALDELLARDLVRPTDVPRRFRFRHPLVRRTVYETAPGGWRLDAHERCAAALEERGASPVARAHHVEHAARHGDAAALAVLRDAGLASRLRAPASAARWFGAALRLLPDSAPIEERGALLMARAEALAATGQLELAHDDMLETLGLVPDEAVALWVQADGGLRRASSTCSAVTSRPTCAWRRRSRSSPTRSGPRPLRSWCNLRSMVSSALSTRRCAGSRSARSRPRSRSATTP